MIIYGVLADVSIGSACLSRGFCRGLLLATAYSVYIMLVASRLISGWFLLHKEQFTWQERLGSLRRAFSCFIADHGGDWKYLWWAGNAHGGSGFGGCFFY
jgi:TRAP-type C4-dicarboxylate transport system permease large subunit